MAANGQRKLKMTPEKRDESVNTRPQGKKKVPTHPHHFHTTRSLRTGAIRGPCWPLAKQFSAQALHSGFNRQVPGVNKYKYKCKCINQGSRDRELSARRAQCSRRRTR